MRSQSDSTVRSHRPTGPVSLSGIARASFYLWYDRHSPASRLSLVAGVLTAAESQVRTGLHAGGNWIRNLSLRNRRRSGNRRILLFWRSCSRRKTATRSQGGDQRFESHLLSQPLAFGYAVSLGSPPAGPPPELVKAADPQARRVPSCHSRPPGRGDRRYRRNCASRA